MIIPDAVFWQKNRALVRRESDDERIMSPSNGSVRNELNGTGRLLWKNIDGTKSAAKLARLLVENYEVTPDIALFDAQALLEEMSSRKLVVTVPATRGISP